MKKLHFSNQLNQKHKALLWVFSWCILFTTSMTTAKLLTTETDLFSLFCARYLTGFLCFFPLFIPHLKTLPKLKIKLHWHIIRAACIGGASVLTYHTYRHLPLAVATTIGFTAPLLASSFGVMILKEKLTLAKILCLSLGYIGVIFIVQPGHIPFSVHILTGFGMCILASIVAIITKHISKSDAPIIIMIITTSLLGLVAFFGLLLGFSSIPQQDRIYLLLIGLFGSISQFAYIKAISYADISYVTPFEYTRLVIAVPIGYFLFAEHINIGQLFGMVLITIGSLYLSNK